MGYPGRNNQLASIYMSLKLIHIFNKFLWRLHNVLGTVINAGETVVYIQTLCLFS